MNFNQSACQNNYIDTNQYSKIVTCILVVTQHFMFLLKMNFSAISGDSPDFCFERIKPIMKKNPDGKLLASTHSGFQHPLVNNMQDMMTQSKNPV